MIAVSMREFVACLYEGLGFTWWVLGASLVMVEVRKKFRGAKFWS